MRFKSFEIRGEGDTFELVKWHSNKGYFILGWLEWNHEEKSFSFQSNGMRYLQYRMLAEWILKWCELKEIEYKYEEEEEDGTDDIDGEEEKNEEDAEENTDKVVAASATSLGYMNVPQHLSDKEWELICESFTRTIKLAKMRGTAFFFCPTHLPCKICPLKEFCQETVYPADVWEKLEKQWKAQYKDDNEDDEKENDMK